MVIRHARTRACRTCWPKRIKAGVINAGDGAHEHPTQALLDAFTIRQPQGHGSPGCKVAIIGDIEHSRVVRSNIHLLTKMGAKVMVGGPAHADAGRASRRWASRSSHDSRGRRSAAPT